MLYSCSNNTFLLPENNASTKQRQFGPKSIHIYTGPPFLQCLSSYGCAITIVYIIIYIYIKIIVQGLCNHRNLSIVHQVV